MQRPKQMRDPHHIYPTVREIDPTKVADLMAVSGLSACLERWYWITSRDLSDLSTEGRRLIKAGRKWAGPRPGKPRGPRPGTRRANR